MTPLGEPVEPERVTGADEAQKRERAIDVAEVEGQAEGKSLGNCQAVDGRPRRNSGFRNFQRAVLAGKLVAFTFEKRVDAIAVRL